MNEDVSGEEKALYTSSGALSSILPLCVLELSSGTNYLSFSFAGGKKPNSNNKKPAKKPQKLTARTKLFIS